MPRIARDAIAVHIETDGQIALAGALERTVERQPLERVVSEMAARRFVDDGVAEFFEGVGQRQDAGVSAAAAPDIERRRSEKTDPQSRR